MKYFNELLESYSKLKKRKLKLLEAGEVQAGQGGKADDYIQKAIMAKEQPSPNNRIPIEGTNAVLWYNKKNNSIFTTLFGGTTTDVNPKTNPEGYQKFVNYFSEGGQSVKSDKGAEANPSVGASPDKLIDPNEMILDTLAQQGIFEEIIDKVLEKINEVKEIGAELKQRESSIFSRSGGRTDTFISQLTSPTFFITRVGGKWVDKGESQNGELMASILDTYIKVTELLLARSITEPDLAVLKNIRTYIKETRHKDGKISKETYVAITADDDRNNALVFKNDHLLAVLEALKNKRFEGKTLYSKIGSKLNITKKINTGVDNAFRGTFMELVPKLTSLQKYAASLKGVLGKEKIRKKIIKKVEKAIQDIRGRFLELAQSKESWIARHSQTAIDIETLTEIETLGRVAGVEGINLIRAAINVSKLSNERGADYILPLGEITGHGRRQDIVEIYKDEQSAKKALSRMGFSDEEIGQKYKQAPLSEIFQGKEDELQELIDVGMFENKNQIVIVNNFSLKNYLRLNEAVLGTTTVGSNQRFCQADFTDYDKQIKSITLAVSSSKAQILGLQKEKDAAIENYDKQIESINPEVSSSKAKILELQKEKDAAIENYDKQIKSKTLEVSAYEAKILGYQKEKDAAIENYEKYRLETGISNEDHEALKQYDIDLRKVWGDLAPLITVNNLNITSDDGSETITKDSFEQVAQVIMNTLRSNSTVSELNNPDQDTLDGIKTALFNTCRGYIRRETSGEDVRRRMLAYASYYAKNSKIIQDFKNGDKRARDYIMMKLYNTGFSVDDNLICDYRGLNSGENYIFTQNEVMKEVMKSFQSNDGVWTVEVSKGKNGFTFVKKSPDGKDVKVYLKDSIVRKRSKEGTGHVYTHETTCSMNRNGLTHYDRIAKMSSSSVSKPADGTEIVEMFIETQKRILETLMSLQKKSVV